MAKQTMGEFLCTLRKANGYTQQEVADLLNVSNRTLSSWETDRTTPDILLLPAIADLYGVTADDLLRGERRQDDADGRISEKSRMALRKRTLGKFVPRVYLLLGASVLWTLIFGVVALLLATNYYPLWLVITLGILAFGGVAAAFAAVLYLAHNVFLTEGMAEGIKEQGEQKPQTDAAFILNVKHRIAQYLIFASLPLFFISGLFGLLVALQQPYYTIALIVLFTVTGLAMLCGGLIYNSVSVGKCGIEKYTAANRKNRALAAKIYGFGAIPVAVMLVLYIVLSFALPTVVTDTRAVYTSADSAEDMKAQLQTITLDENSYLVTQYGHEAGSFTLDFNTENQVMKGLILDLQTEFYDLGYGFYGTYNKYSDWTIYMLKAENLPTEADYGKNGMINTTNYFKFINQGYRIYSFDGVQAVNVAYYASEIYGALHVAHDKSAGEYRFELVSQRDMQGVYLGTLLSVTGATVLCCTILFAVRRTKYNYST